MMKFISALALGAGLAAATMPEAPKAAAAAAAATHTVVVGGLKPVETGMAPVLAYSPESITANMGDVVVFNFLQKNHTVTQSTFEDPCKKMDGGLDSEFKPNPDGKPGVSWEMTVPSMEPLWFYCKQKVGMHCGVGMVFSVNAKTEGDKTFSAYKQLAIKKYGNEQMPLSSAGIQQIQPNAQAAPSTVTLAAEGGGYAKATATATATASALAPPSASVVAGKGVDGAGQACACQCLCGMNSFPSSAAVGAFGGFAGMM